METMTRTGERMETGWHPRQAGAAGYGQDA